jgi:hypothetical protein
VDVTGLQTFPEAFAQTTPLGTLSDWGWHTIPNTNGWDIDHFQFKKFPDLNGRLVPYADVPGIRMTPEINLLRESPHRLHLGQVGFVLKHADGSPVQTNDLTEIEQRRLSRQRPVERALGEPVNRPLISPSSFRSKIFGQDDAFAVEIAKANPSP